MSGSELAGPHARPRVKTIHPHGAAAKSARPPVAPQIETSTSRSVRPTILVGINPLFICIERCSEVIARIAAFITSGAVADFQINDITVGSVRQLVGDALRGESSAHAGRKIYFFRICYERGFTLENVDELILLAVPMQERGFTAGCKPCQVYPEILETKEVAQRSLFPLSHAGEEGLGVG